MIHTGLLTDGCDTERVITIWWFVSEPWTENFGVDLEPYLYWESEDGGPLVGHVPFGQWWILSALEGI
jgi:hypothetical protein